MKNDTVASHPVETPAGTPDRFNDGLSTFGVPRPAKSVKEKNKSYLDFCPERIKKYLTEFYISVIRMYPDTRTESPFRRIDLPVLESHRKQLQKLLEMLTHTHTVLNKTYRQKDDRGIYQSTREDYINALAMLKPLAELYKSHRSELEKDITALIRGFYKPGELFTRRQLGEALNYSKTHTTRIIKLLEERGSVVKAGGFKNKGYQYMLTG